jgi:hypothetical protein
MAMVLDDLSIADVAKKLLSGTQALQQPLKFNIPGQAPVPGQTTLQLSPNLEGATRQNFEPVEPNLRNQGGSVKAQVADTVEPTPQEKKPLSTQQQPTPPKQEERGPSFQERSTITLPAGTEGRSISDLIKSIPPTENKGLWGISGWRWLSLLPGNAGQFFEGVAREKEMDQPALEIGGKQYSARQLGVMQAGLPFLKYLLPTGPRTEEEAEAAADAFRKTHPHAEVSWGFNNQTGGYDLKYKLGDRVRNLKQFYNPNTQQSLWLDPEVDTIPPDFKTIEAARLATKGAAPSSIMKEMSELAELKKDPIKNAEQIKVLEAKIKKDSQSAEPNLPTSQDKMAYTLFKKNYRDLTQPEQARVWKELEREKNLATGGVPPEPELPGGPVQSVPPGEVNPQALAGLSLKDQTIVKGVANYEIALPGWSTLRTPYWQNILARAKLYDPTFEQSQYAARQRARIDFTSGKSAFNIRSLNTAVAHLGTLAKTAENLNNSPIQLWNTIANYGLTATGDPRVVEFNAAADAVESELAAVFKGMGATDQEIKAWKKQLDSSQSPEQLNGAINRIIELLAGRLDALRNQYEIAMGKPYEFRILSERSRETLKGMGVDIGRLDPGQPRKASTTGTGLPYERYQLKTPTYKTEEDVKAAYKSGKLTKKDALRILKEQFGRK